MHITPISHNLYKDNNKTFQKPVFGHGGEGFWKSDYSTKDKCIVAGTTALGVTGSLLALAKYRGHKLNPKSFMNYLKNTDFLCKEIVTMGIGTCLGGLAGGYLIDKDKQNRKAKLREAVMQIGNISIPIAIVDLADKLCNYAKVSDKTAKGKATRIIASITAIISGIYLANATMNKLSNYIFKNKSQERDVQATDLSPHLDDVLASAKYVAKDSQVVHYVQRIIPFALMVAGNEIGNKKAN